MQEWLNNFRDFADLNAQLQMANWAKWMFWATIASLILSAGALAGLFQSLKQTRQSLAENKLTGALERRAWLTLRRLRVISIGGCPTDIGDLVVTIEYEIENTGLLPATDVYIGVQPFEEMGTEPDERSVLVNSWRVIPPHSITTLEGAFFVDTLQDPSRMATIAFVVRYSTDGIDSLCETEAFARFSSGATNQEIALGELLECSTNAKCGTINHTKMT